MPSLPEPPAHAPAPSPLRAWLRSLKPAPLRVDARERWRAALGAAIGILLTGLLGRALAAAWGLPTWLVAPMGASAVLVFALPASPLAQPWAVLAGNGVSTLIGVACGQWIPDPVLAATLAVGLAIGTMFLMRCLHPPGGAAALLAALSHAAPGFALFPVLLNSLVLVLAGMAWNRATGRRYPHAQQLDPAPAAARFGAADVEAAVARYGQVLDVPPDDLAALLLAAEEAAWQRNFGVLRCADVMGTPPIAVQFGTSLEDAWGLLRAHRIKALPVTDRAGHVIGIVTLADFLRHAGLDRPHRLAQRVADFVRRSGRTHGDRPEVVGQIMTREVRVASAHRPLAELVPAFTEAGHHHLPVIDEARRLVGVLTESDVMRALHRGAPAR